MTQQRMQMPPTHDVRRPLLRLARRTFLRPQLLTFAPALGLALFWFGWQGALILAALTMPLVLMLAALFDRAPRPSDPLTGHLSLEALIEEIDDALAGPSGEGETALVIALEIDDGQSLADRIGPAALESVLCRTADRLASAARSGDRLARIGPYRFALLFWPVRQAGMDLALRSAERLQGAASDPVSIDQGSLYITLSAGFCLERRAPRRTGAAMLEAACTALEEALLIGEGAVRAYSGDMRVRAASRPELAEDLTRALDAGELVPWFQPQVAAGSGAVSGMEALARWEHPSLGILPPAEFVPVAEATGQLERLGEAILFGSLSALRAWDREGRRVPRIAVSFSSMELRNPRLVDRVKSELDRFDLAPDRLTVEIMEALVADPADDAIAANIAGLAALGCGIDLDDFGTGSASIAAIRRFAISRIKIDRSFVTCIDTDPAQRKMVSAVLSMAEKLDLDTLAEGVERGTEAETLIELGCGHLQGYFLAQPMPPAAASEWLDAHSAGIGTVPSPNPFEQSLARRAAR